MVNKSFEIFMSCDNCGHSATYDVPERSRIEPFGEYEGRGSNPYSHYIKAQEEHIIPCKTCKLPSLMLRAWDERTETANA